MFKDVIAPIQAWLLSQGRCVGVAKNLKTEREKLSVPAAEFLSMIQNPASLEELFLKKFSF